jgi:hypothetical protein
MPLINNPLLPVIESYSYTRDALTITDRLLDVSSRDLNVAAQLSGTQFELTSRDVATEELLRCYDLWEDYIVLALWAAFERELIGFISRRFPYAAQTQDTPDIETAVTKTHDKFVERGSTEDRINLFKKVVPDDVLKVTHQIKDYRNWVAHQNPSRGMPEKVDVEMAYDVLTSFLEEIDRFS